jgi:hypothetical protein
MKWLVLLLLLVSVCCSKGSDDEDEDAIEVDAKYTELTKQFGDALARKDYRSAYDLFSTNLETKISYNEFVETVSPYMDGFSGTIEAGYSSPTDPEDLAELVPQEDRSKLVAEYTIELSGTIEEEEDAAYFCTVWVIDDAGTPRIASFYIED